MPQHIGAGYGSEYHLMRYMARYRNELNRLIGAEIGGTVTGWLDYRHGKPEEYYPTDPKRVRLPDREWEGMGFLELSAQAPLMAAWRDFWPQSGRQQNWDAVGKASIGGIDAWLLVEAKAHIKELQSNSGATNPCSIATIQRAFSATRAAFGVKEHGDWMKGYYQYANRLAALYFLHEQGVPARLVLLYFLGDKNQQLASNDCCPTDEEGWKAALATQDEHLGLADLDIRSLGVHKVFVPVAPGGSK